MRALLPEPSDPSRHVRPVDLHDEYGKHWLEHGGLRVNFVASVDGASSADGKSEGLQTPGDNRIFAALRDLADVVLVGAGTAVGEDYGPLHPSAERRAVRRARGLADVPRVAVLSRTLRLDPDQTLFTDADPAARTIVLTCRAADDAIRARLKQVAEVVDCGEESVDPVAARRALEQRGLTRILCEGGPTVLAQLVDAEVVDELCLSIAPLLTGPGAGRITAGDAWPGSRPLTLAGLLEDDGTLFCRYRVGR